MAESMAINSVSYQCQGACPSMMDMPYGGCSYSRNKYYGDSASGVNSFGACKQEIFMPQFWGSCSNDQCGDAWNLRSTYAAPLVRNMYNANMFPYQGPQEMLGASRAFPWRESWDPDYSRLWNKSAGDNRLVDRVFKCNGGTTQSLPVPGLNQVVSGDCNYELMGSQHLNACSAPSPVQQVPCMAQRQSMRN